jgi:hypothetical protein
VTADLEAFQPEIPTFSTESADFCLSRRTALEPKSKSAGACSWLNAAAENHRSDSKFSVGFSVDF